jgi:hypothetical protein
MSIAVNLAYSGARDHGQVPEATTTSRSSRHHRSRRTHRAAAAWYEVIAAASDATSPPWPCTDGRPILVSGREMRSASSSSARATS